MLRGALHMPQIPILKSLYTPRKLDIYSFERTPKVGQLLSGACIKPGPKVRGVVIRRGSANGIFHTACAFAGIRSCGRVPP